MLAGWWRKDEIFLPEGADAIWSDLLDELIRFVDSGIRTRLQLCRRWPRGVFGFEPMGEVESPNA
jgi:hypothetical protein